MEKAKTLKRSNIDYIGTLLLKKVPQEQFYDEFLILKSPTMKRMTFLA